MAKEQYSTPKNVHTKGVIFNSTNVYDKGIILNFVCARQGNIFNYNTYEWQRNNVQLIVIRKTII